MLASPDLRVTIDAILRNLGLAHSEDHRIPAAVDAIMAAFERAERAQAEALAKAVERARLHTPEAVQAECDAALAAYRPTNPEEQKA